MSENLRELVEDLAIVYPDGTPALVQVDDYLERSMLAQALADEAGLYGIALLQVSTPEDAQKQWPTGEGHTGRAGLALIDAGVGERWAPWLEANREAFPAWMRFVVVLVTPQDLPVLARLGWRFASSPPPAPSPRPRLRSARRHARPELLSRGAPPPVPPRAWSPSGLSGSHLPCPLDRPRR